MKRTLKKLLAFSLVLALVGGMFAGCSGKPSSSATNSASASAETVSSAGGEGKNSNAERENVTIRFSQYANNTDDQEYMASDPILKAIEEAVNVTIEYDTGIEGYDDRLATEPVSYTHLPESEAMTSSTYLCWLAMMPGNKGS